MRITLSGYNGETAVRRNGRWVVSRRVLERNALDMLEHNEDYGDLSFCDAEAVIEIMSDSELVSLLAGRLSSERVAALAASVV